MIKQSQTRTTGQKIGTVFIFIILGLCFVGIFSRILINENILIQFAWAGVTLSVPLLGLFYYIYTTQYRSINHELKNNRIKPLTLLISLVFGMPLLCAFSAALGVPPILHYFISTDSSITVTVISARTLNSRRSYCTGSVYVQEYKYIFNDHLCGINKSVIDTLEPGDKLLLTGKTSSFGFTYNKYMKLTNRSSRSQKTPFFAPV